MADTTAEPIAIIGSSCRFPGGANSSSKLWELLKEPHDLLSDIPLSRFNAKAFYHENGEHHGSTNVLKSYFLEEDPRLFDHTFFNIHPKEAEAIDPQQRLLLETVYESIESAGYSLNKLRGSSTAVYVGQMTADYFDVLLRDVDSAPQYLATGVSRSIMSNRISYFFDWKGPSVTIDTACSSSLVAVHQAVQTLRNGESDIAVAAGVNLILGPELYIFESKLHMLSPTGRSRMWDSGADGYARGEGFASVVLKPLKNAIADGDHIECVIRSTGVNQDGRTPGITMPSALSQAALIRSTYARVGLDVSKLEDRCQYFEAHGTGTLAGDPKEAEAIQRVFFPKGDESESESGARTDDTLFVGSIKTVIGHLEGTAGLAGLLKASLAVQHGLIPPNMHFNKLNPAIEPFYTYLQVPTQLQPWPTLPAKVPRRASINSFGFGGTNSHVIIESWEPPQERDKSQVRTLLNATNRLGFKCDDTDRLSGPLTFSAHSQLALTSMVTSFSQALKQTQGLNLANLAFTLQAKRTEFQYKTSFSASTRDELISKLEKVSSSNVWAPTSAVSLPAGQSPRILGVFTGQGAQWPAMGAVLYTESALFQSTINLLDASLAALPEADRPPWSLAAELQAPAATSRVGSATISQPLCTAIQIALVDLLRASGITFSAVLGHSSGEIAAVYAAGYLNASDAIRIAYYRGFHAKLVGNRGKEGKMMAVGMSYEQALEFCEQTKFRGRITAAASNARSSTTLSGDADAIDEAKEALDQQQTFARLLKVDKAYHSHHMQPCAEPYLESLRRCQIQIHALASQPDGKIKCKWYSSVYGPNGRSIDDSAALKGQYWVDNLVRPVLFSQALDRAVTEEHCHDMVLEVGPHPALKGPVSETLKTLTGVDLPYSGVLKRGEDDMTAFSDALGFIWSQFLQTAVPIPDFDGFRNACVGDQSAPKPTLVKDLPPYPWVHEMPLWKESRQSKKFRTRSHAVHELLGTVMTQGDGQEMRWRNVMKLSEMPWLDGHQFQDQVLYPAAGYVSMAIEAAVRLTGQDENSRPVRLVELRDLVIHQAITLDKEDIGTEVIFVIRVIKRDDNEIRAEYSCYSSDIDGESETVEKVNFTGQAVVALGDADPDALPSRVPFKVPMSDVPIDRLYASLTEIGLKYSGDFLVESAQRRLGLATVLVARQGDTTLLVHPSKLDAAFHGLFTAFSYPGDGRLWTTYLPTSIRSVRVNMSRCADHEHDKWVADCHLEEASAKTISGSIDIFCAVDNGHQPEIQVDGLTCSSFTKAQPRDDRKLFLETLWKTDISTGLEKETAGSADEAVLSNILQRVAYFYLRRLREQVSRDEVPSMQWQFQCLMEWALDYTLPRIEAGRHPRLDPGWATDTLEMITAWREHYSDQIDMQLITAIGENLPAIVRNQVPALQVMMTNNMLSRIYEEGVEFVQANNNVAQILSQLGHRYPRLNLIEIGAGTGGTTKGIVRALPSFKSYTYTDISPGFFQTAQDVFKDYAGKMEYSLLDIERDPAEQGYKPNSFDVIVASNVLHATKVLANTLQNCRRLLRPGGYLVLMELTEDDIRAGFIMSTLPGWWLGREDGRQWSPTISQVQWDSLFLETGFSGIDTACVGAEYSTTSVMITQAVDDTVAILREPLSHPEVPLVDHIIIVGGTTLPVVHMVRKMKSLLRPFAQRVTVAKRLEDFAAHDMPPSAAIVCLSELDEPAWASMTTERFEGMKNMILGAKHLLWITRGRRDRQPYSNMLIGMCRSISHESPHIKIQFLDVDALAAQATDPILFSETLLRIINLDTSELQDVLWSLEPELAIEEGRLLISRVVPDEELNSVADSEKRFITKDVSPASAPVEFVEEHGDLVMQEVTRPIYTEEVSESNMIRVQAKASSMFPIKVLGGSPSFLSTGTIPETGKGVAVLAPTNSSLLETTISDTFTLTSHNANGKTLRELLLTLFAESLIFATKATLWAHDADDSLSRLLVKTAATQGKKLFLSTSTVTHGPSRVFIHPCSTERGIRSILPVGISTFVNMNPGGSGTIDGLYKSILGGSIDILSVFTTTANGGRVITLNYDENKMRHIIDQYCSKIVEVEGGLEPSIRSDSITGENLPQTVTQAKPFDIVNWESMETVRTRVRPIDPNNLFSGQKTYLLIGLTGELGLSLCQWMADHGARHIAITSRNPKIDPSVIEDLSRRGLNLRIFPLDIADLKALKQAHEEIRSSMPPIAGVANAAMVLRDKPFDILSLEDFEVVLGPKVTGSRNLDKVFYSDDLDFFIMFSSLACVVGSKGQSNYGTANLYMHSLAQQRRKRGVAASIIDIPALLGIGYVARTLDQYESTLKQWRLKAISEVEFHSMFAAAIVSGHPSSTHGPELITGLNYSAAAAWSDNPRFAHCAHDEEEEAAGDGTQRQSGSATSQDIKAQLASAENSEEALSIIGTAFARKLELILQVPADKIDPKVPLMKLGIDSLVAVEIRSFFLKEVNVDMPVLKVLSGASLSELCRDAYTRLPEALRPSKGEASTKVETSVAKSQDVSLPLERPAPESLAASDVLNTPPASESSSEFESTRPSVLDVETTYTSITTPGLEKQIDVQPLHQRRSEMSFAQARLYFLHVYLEDKSTYNVTMVGKISGSIRLDIQRLQRALVQVGQRHECLRSSFFIDHADGKTIQAVNTEPNIIVEQKSVETAADVASEIELLHKYQHNIELGETMKVVILSTADAQHIAFSYHHIVLDGVSWFLFLNELDRAYAGHSLDTAGDPKQAIDMSAMQRRDYTPEKIQDELEFWRKTFANPPDTLPLFPFAKVKNRQILREYDTETFEIRTDANWARRVKEASGRIQVTPFHFYLAALAAFVASAAGVNDFSIGIMDTNRLDSEYMMTLGYFLNLLPLRFRLGDGNIQFDQLAQKARDHVYEALANSRAPFDVVLDHLQVDRSNNQNPLFQIAMNYRVGGSARNRLGSRNEIEWTTAIPARNPYDLIVDVTETAECTQICFTTQKYLYSASDAQMMMGQYQRALEGLMKQPSTRVTEFLSSTTSDAKRAITLGRGERKIVDWPGTLAHRINEVATRYPDSIAVKDGPGHALTYSQLMARADQIASALIIQGLRAGSSAYIGVLLEPVSDVVSSLLAIMHLGLVYVPLDLRNPPERLASIVSDCKPATIICQSSTSQLAETLSKTQAEVLNLSALEQNPNAAASIRNHAQPNKPGFAIYTSGSTGKPKGVILTHAGVLNQIWAISKQYGVGREIVLQQSSFGFDLALEQIFVPLANGGSVVIAPSGARGDAIQLAILILREGITYTEFVPSEYLSLLRYGSEVLRKSTSWRFAFSGGEKVTPQLRRAFRKLDLPDLQLINLYGPAEASLSCTRGIVPYRGIEDSADEGDSFSGYVMPNYSVVILDQHQQPLPVGFPGEICIGGAGTALGYRNRPEETAAKFIPNKFATLDDEAKGWTTLYRSGDKGRLLEDGSLHFLGRMDGDTQVKIHGIRIELNEIASIIVKMANTAIVDAAVSWRAAEGILAAFVVFADDFAGNKSDFLKRLKISLPLPSYMCPSVILPIHQIPTNPNGKKDHIAIGKLPTPNLEDSGTLSGKSLTDMEKRLKEVWEEVIPRSFGVSKDGSNIKADSDFFHVGGNSLLLIKLQSTLRATFDCRVSLPELFQSSTLSNMARRVEANARGDNDAAPALPDLNWHHEIASLMDGLPTPTFDSHKRRATGAKSGLTVLLTGATGFLGRHILNSLVESERVREVHCVAIRPDADGKARHVIPHAKVVEHAGDLSARRLGLSAAAFQQLSDRADVIIHNGADVSFLKSYASLRRPNVLSTRALIEMAIPRAVPVHFVSTASVAAFGRVDREKQLGLPERSLADDLPHADDTRQTTALGYAASKWVSENLVERAAAELGLAGCGVHRLASAVGEGAPETDLVGTLFAYSRALRAVPRVGDSLRGAFDLVRVEAAARDIAEAALRRASLSADGAVEFTHHCGETKVAPGELRQHMEKAYGGVFEEMELDEWLGRARDRGLGDVVYGYLTSSMVAGAEVRLPVLRKGK
ncbi:hybrid PKS-NRPS PsoA [Hypoxylon cercidicola]|nr:hybrid PKS-NRPS PsoA [Hypoxylon cercidicola]